MKQLQSLVLFLVLSTITYGQFPVQPSPTGSVNTLQRNAGAYEVGRGIVITNFIDTTAANNVSFMKGTPYIEIRTSDDKIWRRNATATQWVQLGGSGGNDSLAYYNLIQQPDSLYAVFEKRNGNKDTLTILGIDDSGIDSTSLSNRINLKLNISDTNAMLTPYAKTAAVALKLNISDTASMLSAYARSAAVTSLLATKLNISDTAAMLAPYSRVTVSSYGKNAGGDSTILLLSNGTRYAAKDSIGGGGASGWSLSGNASAVTDFLGTTNDRTLRFRTNNVERMVIDSTGRVGIGTATPAFRLDVNGDANMNGIKIGRGGGNLALNMAIGFESLSAHTTNTANVAIGYQSQKSDINGFYNTSVGYQSMFSLNGGTGNTSLGSESLYSNISGLNNTALGYESLRLSTASDNTAIGNNAMRNSITASNSVAVGTNSLKALGSGQNNTALGHNSAPALTSGNFNTFLGRASALVQTGGSQNTAVGTSSMLVATNCNDNTALGFAAGYNLSGLNGNTTGSNNIFIGTYSGGESSTESNRTWIGNTSTTSTWVGGSLLVGTRTNSASAALNVESTTKGLLIPRMTLTQRNAIASPAAGLQVYNTDANTNDYYNGTAWSGNWSLSGNASAVTDFLGTTNNRTMRFRTNNVERMVIDSTGKVGIGNNAPTSILDMVGSSLVVSKIKTTTNSGASSYTALNDANNSIELGMWGSTRGTFGAIESNNGYIYGPVNFAITSTQAIKFGTGASVDERMRVTPAGRVLIGTITENGSAILNVTSTTQGVLFPRMTTVQKLAIGSPAAGLQVYDTTLNQMSYFNGSSWVNF